MQSRYDPSLYANGAYWRFGEGGSGMEAFGIIGMSFGIMAMGVDTMALAKISKLRNN